MPRYDTRGRSKINYDPLLSNISVGWSAANQYVGDVLFPAVRVGQQSGEYYYFGPESFVPPPNGSFRAPGSRANEVTGPVPAEDNYFARERALEIGVTDEERELYADSPLTPDRDATETVTSMLTLERELEIHRIATDPATYHPDHVETLVGAEQFNDPASDPIGVFRRSFRRFHRTLQTVPNLAIIPFQVMTWLEDHPQVVGRYVAQGGVMTAEMIASLLGVQRVFVPGGAYNSKGNPARPDELSYIWESDIVLAWVPQRPGRKVPSFGYEFVWPVAGRTQAVDRRRDDDHIRDLIRVRRRNDLKIIAKDEPTADGKAVAGYLIKNVIDPDAE